METSSLQVSNNCQRTILLSFPSYQFGQPLQLERPDNTNMSGTIDSTNTTRPVEEKTHLVGQLVTGKEADNYKMVTVGTLNHKSNVTEDLT